MLAVVLLLVAHCDHEGCERDHAKEREALVQSGLTERGISDPRVLLAMRKVPRHRFVPWHMRGFAYADRPLPIGHGQTISQPYIVAYMTESVSPKAQDRCLEIWTGSGYQAAVLAELCAKVFSIELSGPTFWPAASAPRILSSVASSARMRTSTA